MAKCLRVASSAVNLAAICFLVVSCGGGGDNSTSEPQQLPPPNPNVINGVTVPPDPGSAGDATVAGIDTDSNGIRDELDRFLATKYGTSPTALAAARVSARAAQRVLMIDAADSSASLIAMQDSFDAGACAARGFKATGLNARLQVNEIFARTVNTRQRIEQRQAVVGSAGVFTRSVTAVNCQ